MRYLVKARLKEGRAKELLKAVQDQTLGKGSVAGDEYLHNIERARVADNGTVHWVEVCFCAKPLDEERPYWEEYFELLSITNAHNPRNCRDLTGTEPWACCDCDCTERLEERLQHTGKSFLEELKGKVTGNDRE